MNIPQGYKQTELGIIPEDWVVVNLGNIAKVNGRIGFRGYTVADLAPKGFGAITLSPSNIINNQIDYSNCTYISWYKYHESPEIKVRNGDILLVKTGSTFGKSAFVKDLPEKATINPQFVLLNNFKCDSRYLSYVIAHDIIQNQIHADIVGGAIPTLSQEKIANFTLFAPKDIAEQRAIAEALSDVDGLIAALDKKIAKKRLLKQGAMQQLLTGKKRLPCFTDEWVNVQIKQLGKWSKGQPFSKDKINRDGKKPCIHYGELFSYGEVIETIKSNTDIKPYVKSSGKDVLFPASDVTPIGLGRCSALNVKNVLLGGDIIILELTKDCPAYISYVVNLNKQQIIDRVTGTTVKHINSNLLGEIKINISSDIMEQQAIAIILSDMDKEIADLEAQRDKYRLLKYGMMQKLLTGQIRLVKQQAKIIPLGVDVPAVREIPVATHIIAGHIVNRSHKSRGWGRTKLQKSLHLIGYCMQLNLGTEYIRNTAGPDDQQLMNHIDQKFRQYRHVNKVCEKLPDGKTHYSYTPTPMIQDVEMAYEKYPKELREQVDALIDKLNTMDLAGAEILSTLYAVWNNRIIKQDQITDDLLIADFYAWSTHKADFEEARVRKALNYMRDNNIIPVGWGKYIDKR